MIELKEHSMKSTENRNILQILNKSNFYFKIDFF